MPSGGGEVLVEPLREAFRRSGMTAADLARLLEWETHGSRRQSWRANPDTSRVKRYLGLMTYTSGSGEPIIRQHVRYETALKLARAIGADPVDVGL